MGLSVVPATSSLSALSSAEPLTSWSPQVLAGGSCDSETDFFFHLHSFSLTIKFKQPSEASGYMYWTVLPQTVGKVSQVLHKALFVDDVGWGPCTLGDPETGQRWPPGPLNMEGPAQLPGESCLGCCCLVFAFLNRAECSQFGAGAWYCDCFFFFPNCDKNT